MSLLCDIGNSFAHFYDGNRAWREPHTSLLNYKDKEVYYINVSQKLQPTLSRFDRWIDLEPYLHINSDYQGLGADRKALIAAIEDGVVVDAGSAITVDIVRKKKHMGGFIYPGLKAMQRAYENISPVLRGFDPIQLENLPQTTSQALFYGTIKPLILAIRELGGPLFVTGGDGAFLSTYLPGSIYDPVLIFKGMEKARDRIC